MGFPFQNGDVFTAADANALNRVPPVNVTGSARTLALSDEGDFLRVTATTACVITIPPTSSVNWPSGAQLLIGRFSQFGDTVQIARGSGVTLYGTIGERDYYIANRYGFVTLIYSGASNVWYITGDLA